MIGILLTALLFVTPPGAWPSWRGPTHDGIAAADANPPVEWSEQSVKWKVALPGRGSATPIVWGNQLFVVSAGESEREPTAAELARPAPEGPQRTERPAKVYRFLVQSLDLATGKENWRAVAAEAVPFEGHHPTHSYAAGSPCTDGQRLYVSFGSYGIYAFDLDGKPLWKRDFGPIRSRLGWGEAVTPVIHNDALVLNWDQEANSRLIVLDAATGATKWEAKRDETTSWNTPRVVDFEGTTQVIINGTNRARSYDLATGKILWEVAGMTTNAIPSPLVENGIAYLMSGYRGSAAVAVPLSARGEVGDAALWRYGKGTPYVPSPILANGRLYFTQANTATLTILDAATGKPLLEGERLPGLTQLYASPMVAAGRIYFVDRRGTTLVMKLPDGATAMPEVLATNKLDDTIDASPVVSGKVLLLRGERHLYALESR